MKMAKMPRWRWWLWAVEAVLLIAVVEHFVVRPRIRREKASQEKPIVQGEQIEALGEAAKLPDGLHEISPSYYPVMEGLAEGSERMLEAQKSVSREKELPIEIENSIGMRFRLVPSGSCLIGSPEGEKGRGTIEGRHVQLFPEEFYMGKFEVTQTEWKAVMGTDSPAGFKGEKRPVEEVTWHDCQRFVNKLCELEGVPLNTYCLPTEAEWEYACRGGTDTAFCFGNKVEQLAQWADYAGNNSRQTVDVGKRRPNSLGLYDMHGNVWEWCNDWYGDYSQDTVSDPTGPTNASHRVLRGGSWLSFARSCRSANRGSHDPSIRYSDYGFRVALAPVR
jgi:formylglycine-generating enzyme required for sulfatase activity